MDKIVPVGKATDISDLQLGSMLQESHDLCEDIFPPVSDWIKIALFFPLSLQFH